MNVDQIRAHIEPRRHEFADPRSLVLPALKFAQTESGHLTREDMDAVAEATGFSPAFVESVASFYDRLYTQPVGKRVVSVCVTLSCMLRGADEVWDHLCATEGVDAHHGGTSPDGAASRSTTARYSQPEPVGTYVMSTAHASFGAARSNRRSSTFGAMR